MNKRAYQYYIVIFHTVCLLAINSCLLPSVAAAQEDLEWGPPPDEFDWIQLTSGEWLKGEIKGLYENELEFDSDKLKLQIFDWEDVKQVRSPRIFGVLIAGPATLYGSLEINGQKVTVTWEGEKKEFARYMLISIAPFGERKLDLWSGNVSLGFNLTRGNNEQIQYNATANIKRRTSKTRYNLDYLGNISETKGDRTSDSNRIQFQFDYFKTKKVYYRPISGEYFRDPLKNIKYKATFGCTMGYYFINTPKTEWEVSAGPGYQKTKFESVEAGQADSEDSFVFLGGTRYDNELTDTIDFLFRYDFQILNKVSGKYSHHTLTSFKIDLTDSIDFDISFVWDRVENPKPDDNGIVPKKDDFNILIGLGMEF